MRTLISPWILLALCFVSLTRFSTAGDPVVTAPYEKWMHGPSADPGYFPIAVWLQDPENAKRYEAAGINLYVGLWQGPTVQQLTALKAAGMRVICEPNEVGLSRLSDSTIVGWMHQDEPDNAQEVTDPKTGNKSYGPPVRPEKIVAEYDAMRRRDPSRPVILNLGQGVANDGWAGRGSEGKPEDYLTYVKGADVLTFDVYPVAGLNDPNLLWYVAKGVKRLKSWSKGKAVIWNCIECSRIGGQGKPTSHQVKAEVWMSLVNGSRGLIYFVHQFEPKFDEHALLDDPEMLDAVTKINRQIKDLALLLNSPTLNIASARTDPVDVPVDLMAKRRDGITYLFAVGMRNEAVHARFQVSGLPKSAKAEPIGEKRSISVKNGVFEDDFQPYDVHLYKIH